MNHSKEKTVPNDWNIIPDFTSNHLKAACQNIEAYEKKPFWTGYEMICISKLFKSKVMLDTYSFLEKFNLNHNEWNEIIIAIAESYSYVTEGMNTLGSDIDKLRDSYYKEVSTRAYELFSLLYKHSFWLEDNDPLKRFSTKSNINLDLMKTLALSTSATWPNAFYEWLKDNNLNTSFSERNFEHFSDTVSHLCDKETPDIKPIYFLSEPEARFPPPHKHSATKKYPPLKSDYTYTRFIEIALKKLDSISMLYGRGFNIIKKGTINIPQKNGYIFLETRHWQTICNLLFNNVEAGKRTVTKLTRKHRDESPHYS